MIKRFIKQLLCKHERLVTLRDDRSYHTSYCPDCEKRIHKRKILWMEK